MHVRPEGPEDTVAVRVLNESVFDSTVEAAIIEAVRERESKAVSLVAESGGTVVGHILFSPVEIDGHAGLFLMGLGPMSVSNAHQRRGIGTALVREGLNRCRAAGCDAVTVLGHAAFYPRFGFVPASRYGIHCEFTVPDEAFMLLELTPGALDGVTGRVVYNEAFGSA